MRPTESFVANPIRSLQTMLRVIAENDPTLPTVVPDGIYGQQTLSAVSAFQRRYGLPVTGITDQDTWDTIVAVYEPALVNVGKAEPIEIIMAPGQIYRLGDSSANLYLSQSMLSFLAHLHPVIPAPSHNGVLDAETAAAILAFQILTNLPQTGELDRMTWKNLARQFTLNTNRGEGS